MLGFEAKGLDEGQRIDIFVSKKLTKYSRSSLSSLFDSVLVKVNGEIAKPGYKLKTGDKLEVDDRPLKKRPNKIDLPILYEDENVIVINKLAGILTHSKGALNSEATVASFIRAKVDKSLQGNRAGIVHRLDRGTSGVIIAAKNEAAMKYLQKQFSTRKVNKVYPAIVAGVLKLN